LRLEGEGARRFGREGLQVADVAAGDKGLLPGPGQEQHPHVGIFLEAVEQVGQRLESGDRQGVERLRVVDGDQGDAVGLFQ